MGNKCLQLIRSACTCDRVIAIILGHSESNADDLSFIIKPMLHSTLTQATKTIAAAHVRAHIRVVSFQVKKKNT